jgi:NADH:ubiquinone oxidoreductase subunit 6 (subunit J)
MSTNVHSKALVFPADKRILGRKVQVHPISSIQAKQYKFLSAFTVLTWIVAVFVAIAFYVAVRNNRTATDWLACILLGAVFIGWILFAGYVRVSGKPVRPTRQGDRHEK